MWSGFVFVHVPVHFDATVGLYTHELFILFYFKLYFTILGVRIAKSVYQSGGFMNCILPLDAIVKEVSVHPSLL